MLKTFARRLSRRLGNVLKLLSPEHLDDSILDKEKNLCKRGIIKEAQSIDLFEAEVISSTELAEGITRIGYLAYAGGPPATKCAGGNLPKLASILQRTDIKSELKIAILKTIGIITINHLEHQDKCAELDLVQLVLQFISTSTDSLQLWSAYCLYNIIVGNIRNMQSVVEDSNAQAALEYSASLNWDGFSCNYASEIDRFKSM